VKARKGTAKTKVKKYCQASVFGVDSGEGYEDSSVPAPGPASTAYSGDQFGRRAHSDESGSQGGGYANLELKK
jgi:hypothetical protein